MNNILLEQPIKQYKVFYKKYLYRLKNRQEIMNELYQICMKFKSIQPTTILLNDQERIELEVRTEQFLTKNFHKELIRLYNKKLPEPEPKPIKNYPGINDSFWYNLLSAFAQTFEQLNESYKQEWNYKTNFLNFLFNCLNNYGLHPNILKRNHIVDKKFNLLIYHFYRSKTKQTDFKIMMNYEQFDSEFVSQYIKQLPIKIGGKLIPFKNIYEVKITTTLLREDEIELFALKNNFKWTEKGKDILAFISSSIDETDTYHPNPFDEKTHNKGFNIFLVEEIKQWLVVYPDAFQLFTNALDKFKKQNFERNILDDFRLALEILLKELLGNQKSLENQLSEVGKYQKKRGATKEATNMFHKLLEYYTKYQNNYIKHNDKVQKNEIEFVVDLTMTFIKYLIKK